MKKFLCLILLLGFCRNLRAQYTVNGNAAQISCNEYRLTAATNNQSGSVWNNNRIDLNQSFDFNFDVILSYPSPNDPGADGIAFVLQPISTSVGTLGSGLGYEGISPAVGVTLDTYQNGINNDPTYDHIAIQLNGDLDHNSVNNIAGPVTIINGNDNIEDGAWHSLHIRWDEPTKTLLVYMDGSLRVSAVKDFVTDVFSGNSLVYWGFTGSTGALNNYQGFKTALNPAFHFAPNQKRCVNEPVTFYDSTISFTTIAKFYWDFGDGSPIDSVDLNPVHTYTIAGDYTVIQRVVGADGCEAINTQIVRIGSKPAVAFTYNDSCATHIISFFDASSVTVGTINNWYWDFGNGFNTTLTNPQTSYATNGFKNIKLAVKTTEGCESDTLTKLIRIYALPQIDFTFTDSVCFGSVTSFSGIIISSDGPITNWLWNLESTTVNTQNATHIFTSPGIHSIFVTARINGSSGCGMTVVKNVFVVNKPTAYFKNNAICQSTPTTFTDSSYTTDGIAVTGWWWDLGNGQFSTQQDPTATYNTAGPVTIRHVVYNSRGCISDTLTQTINVQQKAIAKFGYSNPQCSNVAIQFSDSSSVAGGTIDQWSWINNGNVFSTQQNPSQPFSAGIQTIGLVAGNNAGCKSDTAFKTFMVNPKPAITMSFNDACKFSPVNFTASDNSGAGIANWKWDFGDGGTAGIINPQHIYNANGTYPVSLFATGNAGCLSDTLERDIIIYSTNAFAGNDVIAAAGQPVQLNATGGTSYLWSPAAGLNDAGIANPIATIAATQTFTVKAYTPQGCESYDDVTVKIYKGPDIYLPNAFTPNGDGLNDVFRGIPVGLQQFKFLKIFNRYGQEIFSTTDYQKGWDGTWKGKIQNTGTYVVIASGIDYRGNAIDKKATVMLIR